MFNQCVVIYMLPTVSDGTAQQFYVGTLTYEAHIRLVTTDTTSQCEHCVCQVPARGHFSKNLMETMAALVAILDVI